MKFFRQLKDLSLGPLGSFYFLFKLYLFIRGSIKLDPLLNILFLFFLLVPAPALISRYRFFRGFLNLLLGFLLLWYDSWLPPLLAGSLFLHEQGMPSLGYIISFLGGWFDMSLLIVFLLLGLISLLARRFKIWLPALLAVLFVVVPLIWKGSAPVKPEQVKFQIQSTEAEEITDPAKYLSSFYSGEGERVIMFRPPAETDPPFDIVILHVCSLSWDDLKQIGRTSDDPFFKQFDYLLTNFNTVTGYSGPAVLRLLQANCGQRPHKDIYANYKKGSFKYCLLLESLTSVGYEPYVSMGHDGKYGNFLEQVRKNIPPNTLVLSPEDLKPEAIFFDGKSLLYNDYKMFKKWFDYRKTAKSTRAVFYYNSILLHAGSHWVGEKKWYRRDKIDQYKDVSAVLLKDVNKMIDLLKSSQKNTVLVFIPEHGRALTNSPFQPPELRDIPLPKITLVPVGIKFIGPKFKEVKPQQKIISKPTSYLAISWLLAKLIENSPFGNNPLSAEEIELKIPKTNFVSEHEERVIIETGGRYLYYGKDKKWVLLTPEQLK